MTQATAESGIDQEPLPAVANQPQEPKPKGEGSVFAARTLAAEVARVAHYLQNDKGFTRYHAAEMLASIARKMNARAPHAWSDGEFRQILGDAASL